MFTIQMLAVALVIGCEPAATAQDPILYVSGAAKGANDGSSWEDAFIDLQGALAVARSGAQIWVAAGTYTAGPPDAGPVHFHLVSGAAMYGGFAGWETQLQQRDWKRNKTILTGDLNGDGSPDGHAVLLGSGLARGTVLDGVVIRDASTVGFGAGAGAHVEGTTITIANSIFVCNGDAWAFGGGIHTQRSDVNLDNVVFTSNGGYYGGAIYGSDSRVAAHACIFESNNAASMGGAIFIAGGSLTLVACQFHLNKAAEQGGAIRTSLKIKLHLRQRHLKPMEMFM